MIWDIGPNKKGNSRQRARLLIIHCRNMQLHVVRVLRHVCLSFLGIWIEYILYALTFSFHIDEKWIVDNSKASFLPIYLQWWCPLRRRWMPIWLHHAKTYTATTDSNIDKTTRGQPVSCVSVLCAQTGPSIWSAREECHKQVVWRYLWSVNRRIRWHQFDHWTIDRFCWRYKMWWLWPRLSIRAMSPLPTYSE